MVFILSEEEHKKANVKNNCNDVERLKPIRLCWFVNIKIKKLIHL